MQQLSERSFLAMTINIMNNKLELITNSNAYYENKKHFEKLFLMQSPYASKSLLKEHEFNFLKLNAKTISDGLLEILNIYSNNPNLCFENVYNFFESFMPDFLDGFFSFFLDAHILNIDNPHFNKESFLKNIKDVVDAWPNTYNKEILQKCVEKNFPKYVLLKNNTKDSYLFIRYGWLWQLYMFIKQFIHLETNVTNKNPILKKNLIEEWKNEGRDFFAVSEWIDYEFYSELLYPYATNYSQQEMWKRCTK